jgi:hypothetical protein
MPSSYRRAAAFAAKDRGSVLRRLSDQKAHLWVGCFDVDGNSLLAQFFRRCRPNRGDGDRLETPANRIFDIALAGNREEMNDLHRRRKHGDINPAIRDSSCRVLQWRGVARERIPVHGHTGHRRSSLSKSIKQLRIRRAVLLHSDTSALQPEFGRLAVEYGEQLAPGVRLRRDNPRRHVDLAERRNRLGPTRCDSGTAKCSDKRSTVSYLVYEGDEGACADACQQDDEVDLSTSEGIGKRDGFGVALNRDFP